MASKSIRLTGVRQNNLKNITAEFPFKKLTVITGLSGSGKSSLAFDTLYAEGQRRYIESLSTYTRQFLEKMPKPDLDSVENIPPSIALEQRNTVMGSRSTVGTQTEIVDYLRVLFAKAGTLHCLECGKKVQKVDVESVIEEALVWFPKKKAGILAPISPPPVSDKPTKKKSPKKKATQGPTVRSLLQVLFEQGFRRVLWKKPTRGFETLLLDDLDSPDFPEVDEAAISDRRLFIVLDRMTLGENPDEETKTRLADSIQQAAQIGHERVAFFDFEKNALREFDLRFACLGCGKQYKVPEPQLFSFNSPMGACSKCSGFGFTLDLDESLIVVDPGKTLKNGAIDPLSKPSFSGWEKDFLRFCERHGISVGKRYRELTPKQRELIWKGVPEDKTFPGIIGFFEELSRKKYKLHVRVFIRRYQSQNLCTVCAGSRLNPEALAVKIAKQSIADFLGMSISSALAWVRSLELPKHEKDIARDLLSQIEKRLHFLDAVGVGYLTLARQSKTLSGGEFQRINLATQLGNGLCGTLYVLDEPSIGLHAADTAQLIGVLKDLRDQGNTVVVVEHDMEVMRAADHLVEMGPGAGRRGGEILATGTYQQLATNKASLTGKYLSGDFSIGKSRSPREAPRKWLTLEGCTENNLKNISVEIPLERMVVVTGVSGSGKSTLVHKTLFESLDQLFSRAPRPNVKMKRMYGAQELTGVVLLDQQPIGKSSRSNPATYLKAWDEVRRVYSNQVISLRRGYTPSHFSFNTDGGRCPVCKGEGEITLDMHFMAEIKLPCEECQGRRFKKNIMEVSYRGKNIHQLLTSTIDDAYDLFRDNPILVRKLGILREVGLGYLMVGQSATTLSGGESQRLKIASILDDRSSQRQLYIFDEPTTGLHQEDIKKLMDVIQDLVDSHNSVVMIEHHLDIIAHADWVIDLGPGGGDQGGTLVAAGTPEALTKEPSSVTGRMLSQQFPHLFTRAGAELLGTSR